MKRVLRDAEGGQFTVGYALYKNMDTGVDEPLFWLETKLETITLYLTPAQMERLVEKMELLSASVECQLARRTGKSPASGDRK